MGKPEYINRLIEEMNRMVIPELADLMDACEVGTITVRGHSYFAAFLRNMITQGQEDKYNVLYSLSNNSYDSLKETLSICKELIEKRNFLSSLKKTSNELIEEIYNYPYPMSRIILFEKKNKSSVKKSYIVHIDHPTSIDLPRPMKTNRPICVRNV